MLQEEKNKRQRYEIKYKLEKYYRDNNMKNLDKQENRKNGKASYLRYKEQDDRQYNIIDLREKPYNEHKDIIKTGGISEWQKIINGAGKNNTFGIKKIYKDPYDYSETGSTYDLYQKNRSKTLIKLPKIEKDVLFNQIKKVRKCSSQRALTDLENKLEKKPMSKEKFFHEPPKTIDIEEIGKIKENSHCYTIYAEESRLSKKFKENLEKNMRNKKKCINLKIE